uniref:PAT complex subunit CCDC47 n=1 Tax=Strongyloides papillosus TaxID=174720 RepID=A0A0N5CAU4_STREA
MKYSFIFIFLLLVFSFKSAFSDVYDNIEDNEFAEFEESFDDKVSIEESTPLPSVKKEKEIVNDFLEDDFTHIDDNNNNIEVNDEERLEDFDKVNANEKSSNPPKPLKFADVPTHLKSNWKTYQVEVLMMIILFIYTVNFIIGMSRNSSIAHKWFEVTRPFLETKFALVGDDGVSEEPVGGVMIKQTECSYLVYCTGRLGCTGTMYEIKLIKRQDLIGIVQNIIGPKSDKVIMRTDLIKGEIEPIIFCIGNKKSVAKQVKESEDLSAFTSDRKNADKFGLSRNFAIYTELNEVILSLMDTYINECFKKYEKYIDYIHVSDQYTGPTLQEGEVYTKMPDPEVICTVSLNILDQIDDPELNNELMSFIFNFIEKLKKVKLSREGKTKADKNRAAVEAKFLKMTHQQRQEAAQLKKDAKIKERKERIMNEEDPVLQRKLQKAEEKREAKAKAPKMKTIKMK